MSQVPSKPNDLFTHEDWVLHVLTKNKGVDDFDGKNWIKPHAVCPPARPYRPGSSESGTPIFHGSHTDYSPDQERVEPGPDYVGMSSVALLAVAAVMAFFVLFD